MSYVVNAWLEREDPQLTVTSNLTGLVLVDWRGDKVRELIDSGELNVADLMSPSRPVVETVKDIILICNEV